MCLTQLFSVIKRVGYGDRCIFIVLVDEARHQLCDLTTVYTVCQRKQSCITL